jgi:integrase
MLLMATRSTALVQRPAAAIVAEAAGAHLPSYVTHDQARAIIIAAETTMHRLLPETLWQSGGRVTEVLRLRPADVIEAEGALRMTNLKQGCRGQKHKLVYVSPDLVVSDRLSRRQGYRHRGPVCAS